MSTSTTNESPIRSFTATATLSGYELVALQTDGTVSIATATGSQSQTEVGFLAGDYSVNKGDVAPIKLINSGGTTFGIAAVTLTTGDALYAATTGKLSSATVTNSTKIGVALQGAVANDVIEVLLA